MLQNNIHKTSTLLAKKWAFSDEKARHGYTLVLASPTKCNPIATSTFNNNKNTRVLSPRGSMDINAKGNASVLKSSTLHKMLNRFLLEKNVPKEELATALAITVEELEQLLSQGINHAEIALKISFSLAKLYCKTKWS